MDESSAFPNDQESQMTIKIDPALLQNLQVLEATVSGPDGANRLFTISANLPQGVYVSSNSGNIATQKETYAIRVGPILKRQQFHRAIASASLTNFSCSPGAGAGWLVVMVDADWDDETQQVEVSVEVAVSVTGTNVYANIAGFGFQVNILATVQET